MRIMHISRATLMVCQFLLPVIETQKNKGHYVCVCGSDDKDVQKLRELGIDVFPHQLRRGLNPFNILKEIFHIKKILVEQKIDTVICHSPLGAGVGRIAAKLAKTPYAIYFAHGLPCVPGQNVLLWFLWFCIEWILGFITSAIVVMNSYDENLSKKYLINSSKVFRVSGMGVDLKKFNTELLEDNKMQICKELHIPENARIALCIAYLIPEKGVFIFQEAAKEICSQRSDIYFLLAGSGPQIDELQTRCHTYGLEDHFKVLGWRDDVYRLMKIADVFVLPTYYFEGLPVSILESMACGKPVISTKHRGCEDAIVDGQTGFLVPIKQSSPVANKIMHFIDDEKQCRQMGHAARQYIEKYFELDYCTKTIVESLEKAMH